MVAIAITCNSIDCNGRHDSLRRMASHRHGMTNCRACSGMVVVPFIRKSAPGQGNLHQNDCRKRQHCQSESTKCFETRKKAKPHLPPHPAKGINQLAHLGALLGLIPGHNGMLDAMANMILDNSIFDFGQRGAYGGNLGDNVDAISISLDHARNTADLTLNAAQAFQAGTFCLADHC